MTDLIIRLLYRVGYHNDPHRLALKHRWFAPIALYTLEEAMDRRVWTGLHEEVTCFRG